MRTQTFQLALQHVTANNVCLNDEQTGARFYAAIEKAVGEIEQNGSIEVGANWLTLVSRSSGKLHRVTDGVCSVGCEAANSKQPCYHVAVYLILQRYFALKEGVGCAVAA